MAVTDADAKLGSEVCAVDRLAARALYDLQGDTRLVKDSREAVAHAVQAGAKTFVQSREFSGSEVVQRVEEESLSCN